MSARDKREREQQKSATRLAQERVVAGILALEVSMRALDVNDTVEVEVGSESPWPGKLRWCHVSSASVPSPAMVYVSVTGAETTLARANESVQAAMALSGAAQRLVHAVQKRAETSVEELTGAATRFEALTEYLARCARDDGGAK